MQYGKPHKPSDLQRKLEGLEQLPGEPAFDTAAVWSRLERRMEPPHAPRHRYLLWAAACLLLAVGAAWFAYQPANLHQVRQPEPRVQLPVAKNSVPEQPAGSPQERKPVARPEEVTKGVNRSTQEALPAARQQDVAKVEVPVTAAPGLLLPAVEPPAANAIALVAKPPVRKLKVVHLNEIGKQEPTVIPVPNSHLLAASTTSTDRQEGRGIISFSRNTSDDIIKINISPTN